MRRLVAAACMTLVASCSSGLSLSAEAPESVRWWAALAIDGSGRVMEASGLRTAGSPADFATPRGATLVAVGFSEAQLAFFVPPDEAARVAPLTEAVAGETAFPAPEWRHDFAATESIPLPRLTSAWLRSACAPVLPDGVQGSLSICAEYCGQSWHQDGCRLIPDLGACTFGTRLPPPTTWLQADGSSSAESDQCRSLISTVAVAAQDCGDEERRCRFEFLTPAKLQATVERVALLDAPLPHPRARDHFDHSVGYLTRPVFRSEQIVVVTKPGATAPGEGRDAVLSIVDEVSFRSVGPPVPAPEIGLLRAKGPDEYIAAGTSTAGNFVARLDENFGEISRVVVDGPRPRALEIARGREEVLVFTKDALQVHDWTTLAEVRRCPLEFSATGFDYDGGAHVVIGNDESDGVVILSLDTCEKEEPTIASSTMTLGTTFAALDGAVLVSAWGPGVTNGVYRAENGEFGDAAVRPDGPAIITAFVTLDERYVAVAYMTSDRFGDLESGLGIYEVDTHRLLPATLPLSIYPIPYLDVDAQGRIVATIPSAAELVRIQLEAGFD